MGMRIVEEETGKIIGSNTIVYDPITDRFFSVSTVKSIDVDKTFVQKCNGKGKVKDFNESFTVIPGDHSGVLRKMVSGELNSQNMNFCNEE